jgi:SanA protein
VTARVVAVVAVVTVAAVLLVAGANAVVVHRTDHLLTAQAEALRPAQAAIVPGSLVRPDGTLGAVVRLRVETAVALYRAGRVQKLLMSGDHGRPDYNEPDAMRDAALAAGAAPEDVFTDYAGFDTWHTVRRARTVFAVTSAVVVTEAAAAPRAVDLARAAGLDAQGLTTRDGGPTGREVLARVRGVGQAVLRPDVVGGPVLPIDGDGRTSWARAPGRVGG